MKAKTKLKYYPKCVVTCACGNTFTTGSTKPEIKVEICSACHPFFTGEMKFVDTQGRVEKFQQKMKTANKYKKKVKKTEKPVTFTRPLSLKEMLKKQKKSSSKKIKASVKTKSQTKNKQ